MSNKIVPSIYRAVIDDVIAAIKPEFDEYGVGEDVLAELQHKWENKVIASHVADFEIPHPPAHQHPHHIPQHPPHHAYPPHPMHFQPPPHPLYPPPMNPYMVHPPGPPQPQQQQQQGVPAVKSEPLDSRFILAPYGVPTLPGPQINGARAVPQHTGGQQGVLSFPSGPPAAAANGRAYAPPPAAQQPTPAQQQRIPQVDGPSSSSSSGSSSPPPSQSQSSYAPHTSHASLPQPSGSMPASQVDDSEAINSDLDDSDTEGEEGEGDEGNAGETDIVFCTYDKVARVKNKWKCILKDGMIHINGRDYLFAKCTGEFEW